MTKRLAICCDGTWDDADAGGAFSNVVRLSRAIKAIGATAAGPIEQIVYYQSGVGTGADLATRLTGGAIGLGLSRNVRDAYAFLANNYCDGDPILLFGFSRGAYTARSIAGLIGWAGLLDKIDMDDFALLWESYKLRPRAGEPPHADWLDARTLFASRHADVAIDCVGVWDTVGALGIPGHIGSLFQQFYNFQDTNLGAHVKRAFQALAIDEHRKLFEPTLWTTAPDAPPDQRIEQVWFAGAHADVGGGYPDHGASDVALAWMADRVSAMLDIDEAYLVARQDWRNAWGCGPIHDSSAGLIGWLGRLDRPTMTNPSEAVHASVDIRVKAGDSVVGGVYAPRNLARPAAYTTLSPMEQRLRWPAAVADRTGASGRPPPQHIPRLLLDLNSGDA